MLAGNDNIHVSLDEFEIQSDLIRDLGNSQTSVYRTIGTLVEN